MQPLGGVSKGEGSQALPFVSLWVQGETKRPGAFLPGCGAGSFPEKNAPHVPVVGTAPCGSKENIPLAYFLTGFHISRPGSPAPSS